TYLELCGTNPNNVLGFTGYQVEGTTGRDIYDGNKNITLQTSYGQKKKINLKAKVMKFPYSGHSSVDGLKSVMEKSGANEMVLIHGDKRNQEYILNFVKDIAKPRILKEALPTKLVSL
ncbi:MAG: hypothetical protein H7644_10095, partial [Candidatus Heimdallarchaeota archaeon]|nr:hypothetical protein [Candidatus Heimdallarchaeota archaeon]MCK5144106.1 hypothetical protein [Candidatus Heimdallarchaeota archaeon]